MRNPDPRIKPPLGSYIDWSHPLAEGLVGCWLFNEGLGYGVTDLVNPERVAKVGNSFSWQGNVLRAGSIYNDVNNKIECGTSLDPRDWPGITIVAKCFFRANNSGEYPPIVISAIQYDTYGAFVFAIEEQYSLVWRPGYSASNLLFHADSKYLGLHTLAVDWDVTSGNGALYYDGKLDLTGNKSAGWSPDNYPVYINWWERPAGSYRGSHHDYYHILIYNRTISPEKHEQLFHEPYAFIAWPSHASIFDLGASGGQTGTLQDTFGLSETRQALGKYNASLSDSMGFSEQETGIGAYLRDKSDILNLSDLRQALAGFLGNKEDVINLSESLTALGNYQRNVVDTLQLSDSLSALFKGIAALTDIFSLTDTYTGSTTGGASLSDVLNLTETLIASGSYLASNIDTIAINDQIVGIGAFVRALTDTYNLTDEYSTQLFGILSDTFTLTDVLGVVGSYLAIKTDSITFNDAYGVSVNFAVTLSDNLTLTDATTALASYAVTLVDTLGLTDRAEIIVANGVVTVKFTAKKFSITFTAKASNINFEGS